MRTQLRIETCIDTQSVFWRLEFRPRPRPHVHGNIMSVSKFSWTFQWKSGCPKNHCYSRIVVLKSLWQKEILHMNNMNMSADSEHKSIQKTECRPADEQFTKTAHVCAKYGAIRRLKVPSKGETAHVNAGDMNEDSFPKQLAFRNSVIDLDRFW